MSCVVMVESSDGGVESRYSIVVMVESSGVRGELSL